MAPYLFFFGSLIVHHHINSGIKPIIVNVNKNHHPLFPTSCNLLTIIDSCGIIVKSKNISPVVPNSSE